LHIDSLKTYITAEYLMGPNSIRILEELLRKHPVRLTADHTILDLGCGKGLTSLVLAKETKASIYANDLWISAEENAARFAEWGISSQVKPVCEDANALHFEKNMFDLLISVDAYHYFATGEGFFTEKLLPFLKDKAAVLIGVPGIKDEYTGRSDELLSSWLGKESYMFQSPIRWREIIGTHERIASVETWEMDCFKQAWDEWFLTGHKYALGDQSFYESLIKPYTCFVGIAVKLK